MKVKKGIAYFQRYDDAVSLRRSVRREFPEARIVSYLLGYAVQTRKSGDYIGPNGRPSMENAMEAFFAPCSALDVGPL